MEAAGVAIGVPGLVALVLSSYHSIRRTFSQLKNQPNEVADIISLIGSQEAIFRCAAIQLLETHMTLPDVQTFIADQTKLQLPLGYAWDERLRLFQEQNTQHSRNIQLGLKEDPNHDEITMINNIGKTLATIHQFMDKYLPDHASEKSETSDCGSPISDRQAILTEKLKSALKSRKRKPKARSTKHLFIHDIPYQLKGESERLQQHIQALVNYLSVRGLGERPVPRSLSGLLSSKQNNQRGISTHRRRRPALSKLYTEITEHKICCSQHGLYICLESVEDSDTSDKTSSLTIRNSDSQSTDTFRALLLTKPVRSPSAAHSSSLQDISTVLLDSSGILTTSTGFEVLLNIRRIDTGQNIPGAAPCPPHLCDVLHAESYRTDVYNLTTFMIHCLADCSTPGSVNSTLPSIGNPIALRDIVIPFNNPDYLCEPYQRIVLAAKLVTATASIHSSPWVRSWQSRFISFFRSLEETPEFHRWKPHITSFNSFAVEGDVNSPQSPREILRALVVLLAEVAGVDMDPYPENAHYMVLKRCLRVISGRVGYQYYQIANRILDAYYYSDELDDNRVNAMIDKICDEMAAELEDIANKSYSIW